MDRAKLITIAVTALITVTVTEFAKWLFAWAKIAAVSDTTKQKTKTIFNRNNRAIIWNSLWLVFNGTVFVRNVRRTTPITREDILVSLLNGEMLCQFVFNPLTDENRR
jgi:hypothetical protein